MIDLARKIKYIVGTMIPDRIVTVIYEVNVNCAIFNCVHVGVALVGWGHSLR